MTPAQPTSPLADLPQSRASSLPQAFLQGKKKPLVPSGQAAFLLKREDYSSMLPMAVVLKPPSTYMISPLMPDATL